jgi:dihydrodipicolinate synthase/N-acetylneuraminate lyase
VSDVSKLSGIIPPLATPLRKSGDLDEKGLERLIEYVLAGGVSGLFLLGTTGEGPHLEPALRSRIVRDACRISRLRVPVLVGLCDSSPSAGLRLADLAAAEGADALVLTPPFYFPLSQDELLGYLDRLMPRLPLPVFLYNIPSLTKIRIETATLGWAARNLPIAGLKDSSGDMRYFAAAREALPRHAGFRLFCGPEEKLLEALSLGADGGVCGGANLFPRLFVSLFRAAVGGCNPEAARLQAKVLQMSRVVYSQKADGSSYLRGLKSALEILGLCGGWPAEPLAPLEYPFQENIRAFLEKFQWVAQPKGTPDVRLP